MRSLLVFWFSVCACFADLNGIAASQSTTPTEDSWLSAILIAVQAVPSSVTEEALQDLASAFVDTYNGMASAACGDATSSHDARIEITHGAILDSADLDGVAAMIGPDDPAALHVQDFSYVLVLSMSAVSTPTSAGDGECTMPNNLSSATPMLFTQTPAQPNDHNQRRRLGEARSCVVCEGVTKSSFLASVQSAAPTSIPVSGVTQVTYHEGCVASGSSAETVEGDEDMTEVQFRTLVSFRLPPSTGASGGSLNLDDPVLRAQIERHMVASYNEVNELNSGICDRQRHHIEDMKLAPPDSAGHSRKLQTTPTGYSDYLSEIFAIGVGSCLSCSNPFHFTNDITFQRRKLDNNDIPGENEAPSCFCPMETDTNEDGTVFLPQDLPTSNEIIEAFNKLQEDSGLTIASLIAQVQVPCPDEATQLPAQFTQLIHLDIVDLNLSDGLQASVDNDPTILSQALGTCIPHTYKHLQSSKVCDSMAHQIIDASAIDVHASDDIDGAYSVSFEAGGSCSGCDPSNPSLFSDNDGGSRHLSQIGAAARTSIRPGKQRALSGGDTADEESELCFCNPDVVDEDHTPAMEDFVSALSECVVHALELGE